MDSFLLLIVAGLALVGGAWLVSRVTGARAYFLEDWAFNEGEVVTWRDNRADVAVLGLVAPITRPMRLHRWSVLATDQRIIVANRTLTGKRMVLYALYPRAAPDGQSRRVGGGLLTRGYATLVVEPASTAVHLDDDPRACYVALKPVVTEASSFNIKEVRIYSTAASAFPLPWPPPRGALPG